MLRHTHCLLLGLLTAAVVIALGCADSSTDRQASAVPNAPAPPAPPAPIPPEPVTPPEPEPPAPPVGNNPAETSNPDESDRTSTDTATNNASDNTESTTARVGFGAKGHYDSNDYISVVVSSQFRIEERITLLNIKKAMQIYRQIHGGYPKTGEVFFKEIIEENGIALPVLPSGQMYGYDPDNPEEPLLILKPKKS